MMQRFDKTLTIQTLEGVRFSYYLAGPVSRFLAWGIDLAVVMLLVFMLRIVFMLLAIVSPDLSTAVMILTFFAVSVGYAMLLEWLGRGQTVGKKLLRLRVVDASGLKLQGPQIIIRNLLRPIDALPLLYCLGGTVCLLHRHCQRLGDIAAGTMVIRYAQVARPRVDRSADHKFNSLRLYPHLTARLRQHVPRELAHIAQQALLRRERLEGAAKVDLFDAIAAQLKECVTFPQEALLGLTSEQYVHNCVEILYAPERQALHESRPACAYREVTG